MERNDSKLTFEEDKPKESKLTYDNDLAKQAAGKAEHASRLQFDETEIKDEGSSHTGRRARQEQDAESVNQADTKEFEEDEIPVSEDTEMPESGEPEAETSQTKRRKSKFGSGSGTGQARQETEHSSKLQFDEETEEEGSTTKQKTKKNAQKTKKSSSGSQSGQGSDARQKGGSKRGSAARGVTANVRSEVDQANEDENAGVEGAVEGENLTESSAYAVKDFAQSRKVSAYDHANKMTDDPNGSTGSWSHQESSHGQAGTGSASHHMQKESIKKEYAVARGGYASAGAGASAAGTTSGTASGSAATASQAKEAVKDTASTAEKAVEEGKSFIDSVVQFVQNHAVLVGCGIAIVALIIILSGFVTACSAGAEETAGTIASTSYLADDDDILKVEETYCLYEQTLQSQIDQIESSRPGYDEYHYDVDEIGHNPFELASYLTVRFGAYALNSEVIKELETLFYLQYDLSFTEETEIRYRENDETGEQEAYEYKIFTVTLRNNGLSSAINQQGLSEDEREYYQVLMSTYGNRPDIFGEGYYNSYYVEGDSYQVPGEALTDERFARMLAEAEKYLGYPYVWGGSSPSTSFDCSGFVSWVINHCGNGWSVGRQTANGLRNLCTAIPASEAQPGDLIFFQGTYNTSGASHVGIYVGNGMMIHCGNPIKYSSINTSYWQKHFLSFGRLPAT